MDPNWDPNLIVTGSGIDSSEKPDPDRFNPSKKNRSGCVPQEKKSGTKLNTRIQPTMCFSYIDTERPGQCDINTE